MKRIRDIFSNITLPLTAEMPLFLFGMIAALCNTLRFGIAHANHLSSWSSMLLYGCVALLFCWLICLLVYVIKNKIIKGIVKTVAYLFFFIVFAVNIFLWRNFHTWLSPLYLLLALETNGKESSEFMRTFSTTSGSIQTYAACLVAIVAVVIAEWRHNSITHKVSMLRNRKTGTVIFIAMLIGIGVWIKDYPPLFRCSSAEDIDNWCSYRQMIMLDQFTNVTYSIYSLHATANDINTAIGKAEQVWKEDITCADSDSINIIYVLGESYIKKHSALYGYYLNTTPYMLKEQKEGRLFAFDDVVTPYNATTEAEKNAFSLNSIADGEQWYHKPMFTTVLKRAGFEVIMYDIQRDFGTENAVHSTFTMNSLMFNPRICELSYSNVSDKRWDYDMQMIDYYKANVRPKNSKRLIIFHLMGQHLDAAERFPHGQGYDRFKASDIQRNEPWLTADMRDAIAQYDNATYYNDCVIREIINLYRDENTVVVYHADHGEEIFDYRPKQGRDYSDASADSNLKHYEYDIPLIIWCSDTFQKKHPDIMANIHNSLSRPFMIDNISHTILSLANVTNHYYIADRDVISPQFKPRKRIIRGGVEY